MGYVANAPYFCMAMDMVSDLANEYISQGEQAREHLLEMTGNFIAADDSGTPEAQADTIWEHLPAEQRYAARANVDVYLEDFVSVFQGGPRERC